jgi:hypothetical protein
MRDKQGDNEVFMINPQEEDGLQADGHEHNEHIEQLNQPNPAPLPLAPAYWVVEEVPVDQLIDPMADNNSDQEADLDIQQLQEQ